MIASELQASRHQSPHRIQERHLIERAMNAAVGIEALRHFGAQVAWHKGRRLYNPDVVQLIFALSPDLQRIAESLCRDEPRHGALPFNQCIGEERCRVNDPPNVARRDAVLR